MSIGRRPNASAIARTLSARGLSRSIDPRARGPTAILRMYMSGRFNSEPVSPTAPFERIECEVDLRPTRANRLADMERRILVRGADHDPAFDRKVVEHAAHRVGGILVCS